MNILQQLFQAIVDFILAIIRLFIAFLEAIRNLILEIAQAISKLFGA